ncbi:MAG: NTP transferase domain-containing protein, partial [Verrucomicrobiota bacterium]|nr:NTP transferase domain-containing protein [Verrucomicrobiota bacterium]
ADAILLMTCDQPLVRPVHLQRLIDIAADSEQSICAAEYAGTVGVPALFKRAHFAALLALEDNGGAKKILLAQLPAIAKVPMPEAATDIDTPAQLANFRTHGLHQSR